MELTLEEKIAKLKADAAVTKKAANLFRKIVELDDAFDSVLTCEAYRDELAKQSYDLTKAIEVNKMDLAQLGNMLSEKKAQIAAESERVESYVKAQQAAADSLYKASYDKAQEVLGNAKIHAARVVSEAENRVDALNQQVLGIQAQIAQEQQKLADIKAAIAKITGG